MNQKTPRRIATLVTSAALLASLTVTAGAAPAFAGGKDSAKAKSQNAASHSEGTGCGSPFGGELEFKIVENNKNIKMTCSGTVDNPSGEAQTMRGEEAEFGCWIPSPDGGGATDEEWFAHMSAAGVVTLMCKAESTRS